MFGLIILIIAIYLFNKKKYILSLFLFFFFITNGYQIIPSNVLMYGVPLTKVSDLGILYLLFIILINYKFISGIIKINYIFHLCLLMFFFIFLDGVYSIFFLDYSIINVFQVFRPYLFLLSFFLFFLVPLKKLILTLDLVGFITVFLSFLFIFQIISGKVILLSSGGDDSVMTGGVEGTTYIRYYNTPAFLLPAFFYFLFVYNFKSSFKKYITISILLCGILGPMHRSLIMSVIGVLSIYIVLRQSVSKRIFYLSILSIIIYLFSFVDIINARLSEAFTDISKTFSSKLDVQNIDINENTMLFRLGILIERFDFIIADTKKWIFGIGLISDNAVYASKLSFKFGGVNQAGNITQIDTGDLIWSILLLNLGLLGSILYSYLFIKIMIYAFSNIKYSKYFIPVFLSILSAFFTSMMGNEMLTITFTNIVLLFFSISIKHKGIANFKIRSLKSMQAQI